VDWSLRDLKKSSSDMEVAGICGGLREHTPTPSWLWRAAFVLLTLAGGSEPVVYAGIWYFMPEPYEDPDNDAAG
jgi:phage shock protein PspC (stress-responsive transcriptional regulator)